MRVCDALAKRGVLTRPIGNVIVLMPPYCTTPAQVRRIVTALAESITEVLPINRLTALWLTHSLNHSTLSPQCPTCS